MATRQQYVDAALPYHGTRWKHHGRTRERLDCVGLVLVPAIDVGLADWSWDRDYTRQPMNFNFVKHFEAMATRTVSLDDLRPGTVLAFRDMAMPLHCGIYFIRDGVPSVLHAEVGRRKVTMDPFSTLRAKAYSRGFDLNFEDM